MVHEVDRGWGERLRDMQARVRDALRMSMMAQDIAATSAVVRDDDAVGASAAGDTIFALDIDAERILLECCDEWAQDHAFVIVAEGLDPAGVAFGHGPTRARLLIDPIDGTRGLMFDKRSAWSLAAVAPDHGPNTRLSEIEVAVMSELPTTRQNLVEVLSAARGRGAERLRLDLSRGNAAESLPVRPSTATDLRHGFATVCNFFQGGKELTARIEEAFFARALEGGWNPAKAELYTDQYISSGGQLAELILGRDRCVIDVRPLVHAALGQPATLCARPYDLCTALIATEAGCVVAAPHGGALEAPLDTTTNCAFAAFANRALADRLLPILAETLAHHL